jgi:hypothetical protein
MENPVLIKKRGKRLNKKSRVRVNIMNLTKKFRVFHNKVGRATDPDSDPDPKKWLQKTQKKFI